MAKFVVPPKKPKDVILLKCYRCGALYSPECKQKSYLRSECYESCPECGYDHNSDGQQIPLWKYNLIKWWRGTAKEEDTQTQELANDVEEIEKHVYKVEPHIKKIVGERWRN